MTTAHTTTALPFLLPAANLTVGDTLYSGAVIDARETAPGGTIHVTLTDGTALEPLDPGELVEVTRRRNRVDALNDVVTTLGELVETWDARGAVWARRTGPESDMYGICAAEVRAILARLQA